MRGLSICSRLAVRGAALIGLKHARCASHRDAATAMLPRCHLLPANTVSRAAAADLSKVLRGCAVGAEARSRMSKRRDRRALPGGSNRKATALSWAEAAVDHRF